MGLDFNQFIHTMAQMRSLSLSKTWVFWTSSNINFIPQLTDGLRLVHITTISQAQSGQALPLKLVESCSQYTQERAGLGCAHWVLQSVHCCELQLDLCKPPTLKLQSELITRIISQGEFVRGRDPTDWKRLSQRWRFTAARFCGASVETN